MMVNIDTNLNLETSEIKKCYDNKVALITQ